MTFLIYEALVYLTVFDMLDFDVILGMDWLAPYHVFLYFYTKMVNLASPSVQKIDQKTVCYLVHKRVRSFF